MRKLPPISLVLGTLLIAGCGGGGGGEDASSPLDAALRYLPADAPFAVAIDTDIDGEQYEAAGDIVERFPFGENVEEQLKGLVEDRAGDLERFEKALGNDFVVGSTDAKTFVETPSGEDTAFVGAIQAADEATLDDLIKREKAKEIGESSGATLYEDDSGDPFAIEGDVLIVAGSKQQLESALATRDGDDSLTEEDFEAGTEGISEDSLLRVYLDVEALLRASDDAKDALKSKWVRALRTAGIGLSFESDEVAIDFNLNTDSAGLTGEDLPIASGAEAPQVLDRAGEIGIALRDPAQLVEFAQATGKAVDPSSFGGLESGKQQIKRQSGVDLDKDLIGQLDGDLSVSVGLDGKFGARAELKDPAAFEQTLAKLGRILPRMVEGITGQKVGFAKPKAGEDFYAIATADGKNIVYGVVDGVFVLSNDAKVAGSIAADRVESVPGAKGALVVSTDADRLAQTILRQVEGTDFDVISQQLGRAGDLDIAKRLTGAIVTRPLDRLTGSVESSTEGLSGSFRLTLD